MIIRVADQAGACFGVQRALDMVAEAAKHQEKVATLGPLIHNPEVVSRLEVQGISKVDSLEEAERGTLVIRTHGVVPETIESARDRGLNVLDATCPYVKKVHHAARKLEDEGYQVFIIGEMGHPEVEGIKGHAKSARVIGSVADLDHVGIEKKVGLVVQTTQSRRLLHQVVDVLLDRCVQLKVVNTICSATSQRQKSAAQLAGESDVMIILGGRNSANTGRLYQICKEACRRSYHIESADELEPKWFEGAERVGITAGASTPGYQIDQVRQAIEQMCG